MSAAATSQVCRDAEYQVEIPLLQARSRDGSQAGLDLPLLDPPPERRAQRRRERLDAQGQPRDPRAGQPLQQGHVEGTGIGFDGDSGAASAPSAAPAGGALSERPARSGRRRRQARRHPRRQFLHQPDSRSGGSAVGVPPPR